MDNSATLDIGATDLGESKRVHSVLRLMAPAITREQIKSIDWLICLNEDGGLDDGRHFTLTCADCETYDETGHPIRVAHSIANDHAGHRTYIGITNPLSSNTSDADTRTDLPVGVNVVSISSGRGGGK